MAPIALHLLNEVPARPACESVIAMGYAVVAREPPGERDNFGIPAVLTRLLLPAQGRGRKDEISLDSDLHRNDNRFVTPVPADYLPGQASARVRKVNAGMVGIDG